MQSIVNFVYVSDFCASEGKGMHQSQRTCVDLVDKSIDSLE